MDAQWIITAFGLIYPLLARFDQCSHKRAQVPDSEIITVAGVAAKYFQTQHARALCVIRELGCLSGDIESSRFNRRLHALQDGMAFLVVTRAALNRGLFKSLFYGHLPPFLTSGKMALVTW